MAKKRKTKRTTRPKGKHKRAKVTPCDVAGCTSKAGSKCQHCHACMCEGHVAAGYVCCSATGANPVPTAEELAYRREERARIGDLISTFAGPYSDPSAAHEKALKLKSQGAKNVQITKDPDGRWRVRYTKVLAGTAANPKGPALFACQECGRKFYTVKSAQAAQSSGCPKCGGSDIDEYALERSAERSRRYAASHPGTKKARKPKLPPEVAAAEARLKRASERYHSDLDVGQLAGGYAREYEAAITARDEAVRAAATGLGHLMGGGRAGCERCGKSGTELVTERCTSAEAEAERAARLAAPATFTMSYGGVRVGEFTVPAMPAMTSVRLQETRGPRSLYVVESGGSDIGFVEKARDTSATVSPWKAFAGIGAAARLVGFFYDESVARKWPEISQMIAHEVETGLVAGHAPTRLGGRAAAVSAISTAVAAGPASTEVFPVAAPAWAPPPPPVAALAGTGVERLAGSIASERIVAPRRATPEWVGRMSAQPEAIAERAAAEAARLQRAAEFRARGARPAGVPAPRPYVPAPGGAERFRGLEFDPGAPVQHDPATEAGAERFRGLELWNPVSQSSENPRKPSQAAAERRARALGHSFQDGRCTQCWCPLASQDASRQCAPRKAWPQTVREVRRNGPTFDRPGYPFADRQAMYADMDTGSLQWSWADAIMARDASMGWNAVGETWYQDDASTIGDELRRRGAALGEEHLRAMKNREWRAQQAALAERYAKEQHAAAYAAPGAERFKGLELDRTSPMHQLAARSRETGGAERFRGLELSNPWVVEFHHPDRMGERAQVHSEYGTKEEAEKARKPILRQLDKAAGIPRGFPGHLVSVRYALPVRENPFFAPPALQYVAYLNPPGDEEGWV